MADRARLRIATRLAGAAERAPLLARLLEGHRARRITKRFPALDDALGRAPAIRETIAPVHEHYVTHVSDGPMAASLETCVFLVVLGSAVRPARVLDLGSGISSYVLRWARSAGHLDARITSVDDDEAWLERTRAFLEERAEAPDELLAWSGLDEADGPFGLIFHDLGDMRRRAESLPMVLRVARRDGAPVVLDDLHKRRYHAEAERAVRANGGRLLDAKPFTRDRQGRFAGIAVH